MSLASPHLPTSSTYIPTHIYNLNDIQYEQTLLYDLNSVKSWSLYLTSKVQLLTDKEEQFLSRLNLSPQQQRPLIGAILQEASHVNFIFERALVTLPGSYKLWWQYLHERQRQIEVLDQIFQRGSINLAAVGGSDDNNSTTASSHQISFHTYLQSRNKAWEAIFQCFERALLSMHKMPLIWIQYIKVLHQQGHITRTRRVFNRALIALPVSQHTKMWKLYQSLMFTSPHYPTKVTIHLTERYLKLDPQYREEFIQYLLEKGLYNDAVHHLLHILNAPDFTTTKNQSKYDIWQMLCQIIAEHPKQLTAFNVEYIIRAGLEKFQKAEVAQLWCSLAMYYINVGLFEKARDIYEEGIQSVQTVRDFSTIFEAYTRAEDEIMSAVMNVDDMENEDLDDTLHIQLSRLERLVERRPILLNAVKLRQNPNNVAEWHKRVQLFSSNPEKVVSIYSDALKQVDPKEASNEAASLWCAFAHYFESQFHDLENARAIFEKALLEPFPKTHEIAEVWLAYAEMEIRNANVSKAHELLKRATEYTKENEALIHSAKKSQQSRLTVQQRVYRNVHLWCLRIDLEECVGDLDSTRALYEETIDLKIATPQMILNYAQLLEENHYFEESFKAYERSIHLFMFPQNYLLWSTYLSKFLERYRGSQVERTRDMFENVLRSFKSRNQQQNDVDREDVVQDADPRYARDVYLLYAKFEEDYGLIKRAMAVYERAVRAVPLEVITDVYVVYINRAAEYYGVTKTRDIYEQALQNVPRIKIREICLRFVELEKKLGEIDRARAIFTQCAKYCRPEDEPEFWSAWEKFEETFVDFDSYKEMLRTKKNVTMQYTSAISFTSEKMVDANRVTKAIREGNLEDMKEIIREAG